MRAREAALLLLCDPRRAARACLYDLHLKEWHELLQWLDTSGLALYFLDRIVESEHTAMLPSPILASLHQRLADNIARVQGMIYESTELHHQFQRSGLHYATLKGFSLWPHSVAKPELRSQLDLDFLIADESSAEARRILEAKGYYLHAVSGRSWEFKTHERVSRSLEGLYKRGACRSVELHIDRSDDRNRSPLSRLRTVCFRDMFMPVLSPADLFLGQGLHLFKHMCSEFSRIAHWIEFRRHVAARYSEDEFWCSLKSLALGNERAAAALGVVILLITRVTGSFAPAELSDWTVDCLPAGAQQWVDIYGERAAYMSFPGTKLYLLLERELADSGLRAYRPLWRTLLPTRLPPPVAQASAQESFASRLARYRMQAWFICFRLRFHVVEGFSYLFESIRWRVNTAGGPR